MNDGPALWWDITKVVLLLAGMVVLGRNAPAIMARLSGNMPVKRQRRMHLLDSLYLGAEKSVHLIEVDGVRLVLGASRGGINLLTQVTGVPASVEDAAAENPAAHLAEEEVPAAQAQRTTAPPELNGQVVGQYPHMLGSGFPEMAKKAWQRLNTGTRRIGKNGSAYAQQAWRAFCAGMRGNAKRAHIWINHTWQNAAKLGRNVRLHAVAVVQKSQNALQQIRQTTRADQKTIPMHPSSGRPTHATRGPVRRGKAGKGATKSSRHTA